MFSQKHLKVHLKLFLDIFFGKNYTLEIVKQHERKKIKRNQVRDMKLTRKVWKYFSSKIERDRICFSNAKVGESFFLIPPPKAET